MGTTNTAAMAAVVQTAQAAQTEPIAHDSASDHAHLYPDFTAFAGFGPGAEEVIRFPYSPYRDVACGICKVPYGEVGVAGAPDFVRSHEMHLMDRDPSGFIPKKEARADRQAERINWEGFEKAYADRLHCDSAFGAQARCDCPACRRLLTIEGAALVDDWNAFADAHMQGKPFLQILLAGYGSDADDFDDADLKSLVSC